MHIKKLIFPFLLIISSFSFGQNLDILNFFPVKNNTNTQSLKLKGNVESISQYAYMVSIKNGKIQKGTKMNFSSEYYLKKYNKALYFNKKGNLVKRLILTPQEDTFKIRLYKYNDKGKLILKKIIGRFGLIENKEEYVYDKASQIIKASIVDYHKRNVFLKYMLGSMLKKTNHTKISKELKNKIRNAKGQNKIQIIFNYLIKNSGNKPSVNNKLSKNELEDIYKEMSSTQIKSIIFYSRQNLENDTIDMITHKRKLLINGKDSSQVEATCYHRNGNIIKLIDFLGITHISQYNSKGQKILEKYLFNNSSYPIKKDYPITVEFTYNQYGDITLIKKYRYNYKKKEKSTSLRRIDYQYDKKGNWTRKIIFVNDVPFLLIQRRISYF